ncbi:MAG: nucleoside deaminase [Candidatus Babeliales bacterium]|nr:nucleoside deaminase [Candidatus Babeliales bacterium]
MSSSASAKSNDLIFMQKALLQAQKAFDKNEVPVGAIIVAPDGKTIISQAYNMVETKNSQTAHAEILAIARANKKLNSWRLEDCVLYVTLEPCSMCMGLILLSRIKTIFFATKSNIYGFKVDNCFTFELYKCPIIIKEGLCQFESSELLRTFFKTKRNKHEQRKKRLS